MRITPFKPKRGILLLAYISLFGPFLLFVLLIVLLFVSMNSQHTHLVSTLEGKQAPKTELPLLDSDGYLHSKQFKGRVTLIHFWGSWCQPCRDEHPILMRISEDNRFDLIGINYKDHKSHARHFLNNFGNPFKRIGFDTSGQTAARWGISGPPETFILDKDSTIIARHTGPLTWQIYQTKILPKIEKMEIMGNDLNPH